MKYLQLFVIFIKYLFYKYAQRLLAMLSVESSFSLMLALRILCNVTICFVIEYGFNFSL